jgi:hypothetical protein
MIALCSFAKRQYARRAVAQVIVGLSFVVFLAACSPEPPDTVEIFKKQSHISAPEEYRECAIMVSNYVIATRSWDEALFNVEFTGLNEDPDFDDHAPMFGVSHIDSWKPGAAMGGGGLSFFAAADCTKMQVIRELKTQ